MYKNVQPAIPHLEVNHSNVPNQLESHEEGETGNDTPHRFVHKDLWDVFEPGAVAEVEQRGQLLRLYPTPRVNVLKGWEERDGEAGSR